MPSAVRLLSRTVICPMGSWASALIVIVIGEQFLCAFQKILVAGLIYTNKDFLCSAFSNEIIQFFLHFGIFLIGMAHPHLGKPFRFINCALYRQSPPSGYYPPCPSGYSSPRNRMRSPSISTFQLNMKPPPWTDLHFTASDPAARVLRRPGCAAPPGKCPQIPDSPDGGSTAHHRGRAA